MDNYLKLPHSEQDRLLDAQSESGQTVRAFCRQRGIKESRFYSWRTRRNRQQKNKAEVGFTVLRPTAPKQLSVVLSGGLRLHFDADELALAADLLLKMDRRCAQL